MAAWICLTGPWVPDDRMAVMVAAGPSSLEGVRDGPSQDGVKEAAVPAVKPQPGDNRQRKGPLLSPCTPFLLPPHKQDKLLRPEMPSLSRSLLVSISLPVLKSEPSQPWLFYKIPKTLNY